MYSSVGRLNVLGPRARVSVSGVAFGSSDFVHWFPTAVARSPLRDKNQGLSMAPKLTWT